MFSIPVGILVEAVQSMVHKAAQEQKEMKLLMTYIYVCNMKHCHMIYFFASKDRNEVFLGKNCRATANSYGGRGGVHNPHSHPVQRCLAVGSVDIVPVNTHVDVDSIVGSDNRGGDFNNLLPGASCRRQKAGGGGVDEELVLVAGLHARALQVEGEACVVATEDVLQAILGEDNLSADSAC